MKTAKEVDALIAQWKAEGKDNTFIVWNTALACVGWSYVYSAWGAECTPAERRKRYRMCPEHPTIKSKCRAFDSGDCSGCQWFPGGERTRCYDCRGFTDWCLNRIGFDLYGDTCGAQWKHEANWSAKGEIATMPKDVLCCLFIYKNNKWTHTGFGYGNETVECSSGVQHFTSINKKWTHWAVPAMGGVVPPTPPTPTTKPTLRLGSTGVYVVECQNDLIQIGYSVGATGADGKFGKNTQSAVKQFQKDSGLIADGVVGKNTWAALDAAVASCGIGDAVSDKKDDWKVEKTYTVCIEGLSESQVNEIAQKYANAKIIEEGED